MIYITTKTRFSAYDSSIATLSYAVIRLDQRLTATILRYIEILKDIQETDSRRLSKMIYRFDNIDFISGHIPMEALFYEEYNKQEYVISRKPIDIVKNTNSRPVSGGDLVILPDAIYWMTSLRFFSWDNCGGYLETLEFDLDTIKSIHSFLQESEGIIKIDTREIVLSDYQAKSINNPCCIDYHYPGLCQCIDCTEQPTHYYLLPNPNGYLWRHGACEKCRPTKNIKVYRMPKLIKYRRKTTRPRIISNLVPFPGNRKEKSPEHASDGAAGPIPGGK